MKNINIIRNEKGIALMMVLLLSTIALAIMAGLIYMITAGTQVSGLQKRYKTAHDAGIGGTDMTFNLINIRAQTTDQQNFINALSGLGLEALITTSDLCSGTRSGVTRNGIAAKILTETSTWTNCDSSITINPAVSTTYDWKFDLGSSPLRYRIYAKIVDTIIGNTGGGGETLWKKGVIMTGSGSGEVPVVHRPYLYTIEVASENRDNAMERAKFTALYQY